MSAAPKKNPYSGLRPEGFWRTGVAEAHPTSLRNLYSKKFAIEPTDRIVTAGSCFAQHVARHMRNRGYHIVDGEPLPFAIPEDLARSFGYLIYSGRYGNIYTARQFRQLLEDARRATTRPEDVWEDNGRFYDGLRPNVEPDGLDSPEEVQAHRAAHLSAMKKMFSEVDVLVFTLGLTEAWVNTSSGTVYPTCPGVVAGTYDPAKVAFKNFNVLEIYEDMKAIRAFLAKRNPNFRMILTVSPVPLTATASGDHVLAATTYSKSALRAVCGLLAQEFSDVDYFPSYEIITAPVSRGFFYEPNLRSVTELGVETVMSTFFTEHGDVLPAEDAGDREERGRRRKKRGQRQKGERRKDKQDVVCEEAMLEAFGRG